MKQLNMNHLENNFNYAIEYGEKFVAVKIEMKGFAEAEIIVNPIENAKDKIDYYKKTYDDELNHKYAEGIKIIGFTFGDNMSEIEEDLS